METEARDEVLPGPKTKPDDEPDVVSEEPLSKEGTVEVSPEEAVRNEAEITNEDTNVKTTEQSAAATDILQLIVHDADISEDAADVKMDQSITEVESVASETRKTSDEIGLKQLDDEMSAAEKVRPPPSNALTDLMMDANITITEEVDPVHTEQQVIDEEEDDLMNDLHLGQFDSEPTADVVIETNQQPQDPYVPEVGDDKIDDNEPRPAEVDLDSDLLQIASESAARSRNMSPASGNDEPEEILDSSSAYSDDDDDDDDVDEDVEDEDEGQEMPRQVLNNKPGLSDLSAPIEINDDDDDDDDDDGDHANTGRSQSSFDDDDRSRSLSDALSDSSDDIIDDYDDESASPRPHVRAQGSSSGSSSKALSRNQERLSNRRFKKRKPRTLREKLKKKSIEFLRRKMQVSLAQPVAAKFGPAVDQSAHLFEHSPLPDFVTAKHVAPIKDQLQRPIEIMAPSSKPLDPPSVKTPPRPVDDDSSDVVEMIDDSTPEVSPVKQNGSQNNEPPAAKSPPSSFVDNQIKITFAGSLKNLELPANMTSSSVEDIKIASIGTVNVAQPATKDVEAMDVSIEKEPESTNDVHVIEMKLEPPAAVVESERSSPITSEPIAEVVNSSEPPNIEKAPVEVKHESVEPPVTAGDVPDKTTIETETAPPPNTEPIDESYEVAKRATKRVRSVSPVGVDEVEAAQAPPSKRLCAELERNFGDHDKTLREYIDQTSNNSLDEVERHLEQLKVDIAHLEELSAAKELEWNNILHLKKCKEEIVLRLNRRKTVMEIMAGKMGEMPTGGEDTVPTVDKRMVRELKQTVSVNHVGDDATTNNHVGHGLSTSQSILASRANMKSADLAKEKANVTRLHSILFSRNILPKPTAAAPPPMSASPGQPILLSQPHSTSSSPILNNYITSGSAPSTNVNDHPMAAATTVSNNQLNAQQQLQMQLQQFQQHQQQQQQAAIELLMNGGGGHHSQLPMAAGTQIGRQGPIKNVRSIIDDHRQKHPEQVPRRGRRRKGSPRLSNDEPPSHAGLAQNMSGVPPNLAPGNLSMTDFLYEFAKVASERMGANHHAQSNAQSPRRPSIDMKNNTSTPIMKAALGYPEVTLHPVSVNMQDPANPGGASTSPTAHSNSLLHGILTKQNPRPQPGVVTTSGYTSYSPTLARLLTAPERINPLIPGSLAGGHSSITNNNNSFHSKSLHTLQSQLSATAGGGGGAVNLAGKPQSEITITPVIGNMSSHSLQQTLMQNQLDQHHQRLQSRLDGGGGSGGNFMRNKPDMVVLDDEADDSVDRLVIDEGADDPVQHQSHHQQQQHQNHAAAQGASTPDFQESEGVPECQGCKKREAQFVCAGCSNQWYCSRSCQVTAWDEHSDVCTG